MSVQSAGTLHGRAVVLIIRTGAELRLKRVLNRGAHAWGAAADVPFGFACWISGAASSQCELSGPRLGSVPPREGPTVLSGERRAATASVPSRNMQSLLRGRRSAEDSLKETHGLIAVILQSSVAET